MQPLIDADVLFYEVGFASEKRRAVAAEGTPFEEIAVDPQSWDFAKEVFDNRIKLICNEVEATEEPLFFVTESGLVNRILNKKRKYAGEKEKEYVPNFRNAIAKTKEYKGHRKTQKKPFHYKNLVNYVLSGKFKVEIAPPGLEADDAMCIYQTQHLGQTPTTILCSRDKDIRQCQGWHYSWECGKQASVGPLFVDSVGSLVNRHEGKVNKEGKPLPLNVLGTGDKFFYFQMITGDSVDNIEGIIGRNKVFAYKLLKDAKTARECYELVAEVYVKQLGDVWEEKFNEMADLLWIVKNLDSQGKIVKWTKPTLVL